MTATGGNESTAHLRRIVVGSPLLPSLPRSNEQAAVSLTVWTILVFSLVIQQSAFIEMRALTGSTTDDRSQDSNIYNTIAIGICFLTIGTLCLRNAAALFHLASKNLLSFAYIALVLISFTWSIHPDLTVRRGFGYLLSMAIASYLVVKIPDVQRMKIISAGFAVSAMGSLIYVAAFPDHGIMNMVTLEGTWRGVFPHKNVLGPVMAVAVFTELYVLTATRGRPRWRFLLLGLYIALVILSRSATAILLSATYIFTTCIYLLWARDRMVATVMLAISLLMSLMVMSAFLADPEFVLGLMGKDITLTGRTELWEGVIRLIMDRPILGYGYRSMWSPGDSYRVLMDELTGGWGVVSSHNAFLEVTLGLGAVGIAIMLLIVFTAFWRSIRCCLNGYSLLGWFSFMYFATAIFSGFTWETLGLNQNVFWLMFSILLFSCGITLTSLREQQGRTSGRFI